MRLNIIIILAYLVSTGCSKIGLMKAKVGIVGISALFLGLAISLFGYSNQEVPVCAPCIEGRLCPPCPSPSAPDYAYFGIAIAIIATVLILLSLLWRKGANSQ